MYTNFYQSSEGGTVSHVDLVPERFTPAQVKVVVELELLCLVKKKIISKIFVGENEEFCCVVFYAYFFYGQTFPRCLRPLGL